MVKIKPGIFNKFNKEMVLDYIECVKMTHTPLDHSVTLNVVNQNITNTVIVETPIV